uniref:Uncharacterized protein n=1 Tax=Avena sativa TaxID=4498 RepID=A0ACD5U8U3_AVESA
MGQQSKRTHAPAPPKVPPSAPHLGLPATPHLGLPTTPQFLFPPALHLGLPPTPQFAFPPAGSSAPSWLTRPQESVAGSSAQGPCWALPAGIGGTASPFYTSENIDESDPQARGLDSHPPGGFLSFFKNTPSHAQAAGHANFSQPINVGDDTNSGDGERTEKRLTWTKEEDLRLVSSWLNNSNDPIQSNYRKNKQYWKEVAAVYNSTTPKNRERKDKQVKDRFLRIKKKVAWFCASWKEANALYASGESDVDLKKRARQIYEADHKEEFMFEHCWEDLKRNQNGTHIWNA